MQALVQCNLMLRRTSTSTSCLILVHWIILRRAFQNIIEGLTYIEMADKIYSTKWVERPWKACKSYSSTPRVCFANLSWALHPCCWKIQYKFMRLNQHMLNYTIHVKWIQQALESSSKTINKWGWPMRFLGRIIWANLICWWFKRLLDSFKSIHSRYSLIK